MDFGLCLVSWVRFGGGSDATGSGREEVIKVVAVHQSSDQSSIGSGARYLQVRTVLIHIILASGSLGIDRMLIDLSVLISSYFTMKGHLLNYQDSGQEES